MEPYTYNLKQVLHTTSYGLTASPLLQARKILEKISKRLKLWMSSVCKTQMLVDPHLDVQDASSGSAESTRSAGNPLMTRHDSITCQSTIINDDFHVVTEPLPNSRCHVQNEGDEYRDGEIQEEASSDGNNLELVVPENDHIHYHLSNASEELVQDPAAVPSWPSDTASPPLTMWDQSAEAVESFDCIDKVRTENQNLLVDMLCNVSSVVIDTSEAENSDQDTQDAGLCVVITPPDDNWETPALHNNRIGPQYLPCLVVPPFFQFTSRLIKYEEWMALYHPPAGTVSQHQPAATPGRTSAGPLVFRSTGFQKHLQATKNDRFNCFYIATALQRHQLKAAAFTASLKACTFRMRYDAPGFLENIEPRFNWIDPAEIIIESFRQTPERITVYTSQHPCSVPHIVIHESPPNDPYVAWSNSTDPQNYCFLTISPPNPLLWEKDDDCQLADNCFTDASSSICDSSAPATPKDFSCTFEQGLEALFDDDIYEIRQYGDIHQRYEDEFVVPQYSMAPQSNDTIHPSKSKFFFPDDEEEDSLPPLDDWYVSIANRCMSPEEAEAVAAAAMSVSCR